MSKKDDYFELWVPIGIMLGASLVGLAFLSVGSETLAAWISQYQTIIGAVIAVFTAVWAVQANVKAANKQIETALRTAEEQIRSTQALEESRRSDKLTVARATLPFALSEMVSYCRKAANDLSDLLDWHLQNTSSSGGLISTGGLTVLTSPSFQFVELPFRPVDQIGRVVEVCPRPVAIEMGKLLIFSQICVSRLKQFSEGSTSRLTKIKTEHNIRSLIVDVCELNARVCRLYDYGRFEKDTVSMGPIEKKEIELSAFQLGITVDDQEYEIFLKKYS